MRGVQGVGEKTIDRPAKSPDPDSRQSGTPPPGTGGGKSAGGAKQLPRLAAVAALNAACPRDLVALRIAAAQERAKALQVLGRHRAAVEGFSAVLDSCPNTPTALMGRGLSFQALGLFDSASADCEAARRMAPGDARFQVDRMRARTFRAGSSLGNLALRLLSSPLFVLFILVFLQIIFQKRWCG